jgi:hypothetical protein
MDQVTITKTCRIKHPRHVPRIDLFALQFVNWPRRRKNPLGLVARQGVQAAKRRCFLLQIDQVALAGQRQARQCLTRHALEGIDPGQGMKVVLRSFLGMRYLTGQLIHQVFFALARIAGFQRIVVTHDNQRFLRR